MGELKIFPQERMESEFPWILWAVGWLATLKAFIWLAYEPVEPQHVLQLLAVKHIINIVPAVIFGIGVWNRRRWAVWGLIILAVGNLIFFIINPQTLSAAMVHSEVQLYTIILSSVTLLCSGPLGDFLILCATPVMLKNTR
jgi:hypothetical protein